MCHSELLELAKPLKLLCVNKLQRKRIEINVAVDVVVDVFGEPEIVRRRQVTSRRQREIFIAVSAHFCETQALRGKNEKGSGREKKIQKKDVFGVIWGSGGVAEPPRLS